MFTVTAVIAAVICLSEGYLCPGRRYKCPDTSTCCQLASGEYGCCPLPHAVCCNDHQHCCPESTTCDVEHGKCLKENGEAVAFSSRIKASLVNDDVICPDRRYKCHLGSTCCKIGVGQYGCCPLPDAVCCNDMIHCCPNGTRCDTDTAKCYKETGEYEKMMLKVDAIYNNGYEMCANEYWRCPNGSTCCDVGMGRFRCCPAKNAICCPDHKHCCPQGMRCDAWRGCANEDGDSQNWMRHQEAMKTKDIFATPTEETVRLCSDGSNCLSSQTCCKGDDGNSKCCPHRHGVCCVLTGHCCPHGFTCSYEDGQCVKGSSIYYFSKIWKKTFDANYANIDEYVHCGVGTVCQPGSTCCAEERDDGSVLFTCCPFYKGTCCGNSCCPPGYECAADKKCSRRANNFPF